MNLYDKKWIQYLEREQELFLFAAFIRPYGKMLKTAGFWFKDQLHSYKGSKGFFYRTQKEMESADAYFARLIETNDARIDTWLQKEEEVQHYTYTGDVATIISKFEQALLFNTVIPYRLLSALPRAKKQNPTLLARLERIRSRSLYPVIFNKVIMPLLAKAAQRLAIPAKTATYLTPQELINVLSGKGFVTREDLIKRKQGCVFYLHHGKIIFRYEDCPLDKREYSSVQELRGSTAYPGKVQGKVMIVNHPSQMLKFKGGVLVSINTNPSLLPAIKRAIAIITDEGGITCHAAIVARELKKPCIIGTKIATRVFKDGEVVEVDAIRGIVRKVKL